MIPGAVGWLLADSTVTGIVADRVFLSVAPEGTAAPYVVLTHVSGVPDNYVSEVPGIDDFRMQADCYAEAKDGGALCFVLATAVRAVFQNHGQELSIGIVGKEVDTQLFRIGTDWGFWRLR